MFSRLLVNEWKETLRSPYLSRSIFQKIFIGLFALYIIANFLLLGFFFDIILEEVFPKADIFVKSSTLLFYYLLFDLITRFFLQTFPVISIKPYLALPVKKNKLIHFLLLKSAPSVFNLLPLLIAVPFYVKYVLPTYGFGGATAWLITVIAFVLIIHYFSFYIKKNFSLKPALTFVLMVLAGGICYADINGYIGFSKSMEWLITQIVALPLLVVIPLLFLGAVYFLLYGFFRKYLYLDAISAEQEEVEAGALDFTLFSRFGQIGELMQLEMKLIWRNKRSRGFLYMSAVFLLFPFILFVDPNAYGDSTTLLVCIMVTGMFAFNYAQLMLSWHTTHFDYLLTRNITGKELFKAKFYLMALSVFISYIIILPFGFFIEDFFITSTAALLFNVGVNLFIYMYIANYNSKKIDAAKGGAFSFEGFGAAHYFIFIPIIGIPAFIFMAFNLFNAPVWGIVTIAIIGLFGVLLQEFILNALVNDFKEEKYKIAAAFRD